MKFQKNHSLKCLAVLCLSLCLLIGLAACGGKDENQEASLPSIDFGDDPLSSASASADASVSDDSSADVSSSDSSSDASSSASEEIPLPASTGTVIANLNMREKPEGEILVIIPKETSIEILGDEGDWYKVSYNNYTGYVLKEYVTVSTTPPPDSETGSSTSDSSSDASSSGSLPDEFTAVVTATTLNVRAEPSASGDKLGTLLKGDTISVKKYNADWYEISFDQKTAYISSQYIEEKN